MDWAGREARFEAGVRRHCLSARLRNVLCGSDAATSLAVLDKVPFWLGATADGQTVAFDQPGQEQAQAMLIENFR